MNATCFCHLPGSSSGSLASKLRIVLWALNTELALLLVARGESDTLVDLLLAAPDFVAGALVFSGRKFSVRPFPISICLRAISIELFESVLPKPRLV